MKQLGFHVCVSVFNAVALAQFSGIRFSMLVPFSMFLELICSMQLQFWCSTG